MKKRKKQIYLSNLWLYIFIIIGILVIIGTGVYAATYASSGGGHPYTEISTCSANQVLKMNSAGTAWTCQNDAVGTGGIVTETDPTVDSRIKDGVSWGDLRSVPPGWTDGDELGLRSISTSTEIRDCMLWGELDPFDSCTASCPDGTILVGCGVDSREVPIGEVIPRTGRTGSCTCNRISDDYDNWVICYAICLRWSSY